MCLFRNFFTFKKSPTLGKKILGKDLFHFLTKYYSLNDYGCVKMGHKMFLVFS
jgi:hypothetical protein